MEDHLILAIKNMTAREKAALQKKIVHQKQKIKLFQSIEERKTADNKTLSEELNYGDNYTGLYTLKNRLFDDIVETKLEIKKNVFVLTKEKIQNLRNLLYDRDSVYLLREIKRLEKNAEVFELFDGLKEVYFCMLLTFRHDNRKAVFYQKLMDVCENKQKLTDKIEQIFYTHLLDTSQDLFYSSNIKSFHSVSNYLKEIEEIDLKLKTKTSYFLYSSAYLTIHLNSADLIKESDDIEKQLDTLLNTYSTSFLLYKYPYCQIAIHCLYSKLYLHTNNDKKFMEVHDYISSHIAEVEGYGMFDCSYFYYLYTSVIFHLKKKQYSIIIGIIGLLDIHIQENELENKTDKMKNYYLYLIAVKFYYAKEYDNCFTTLMKARNHFSQATENTIWVYVENIMLSILINIKLEDINFIFSELNLLRRLIKKSNMESQYIDSISTIMKGVKNFEIDKDFVSVINMMDTIKKELKIFKLIDLSF